MDHDGVEVFGVGVGRKAEVEPTCAPGLLARAASVKTAVEERRFGRAFGAGNPKLRLHARGLKARRHRGHEAVEDGITGFLTEAKRFVQSDLVALYSVARHLRHALGHDNGAVGERLAKVARAQVRPCGDGRQGRCLYGLQVFFKVVARVLAGLSQVVEPPLRITGIHRVHKRGFSALTRRGKNHRVIVVGADIGVDFARHVGNHSLPRQ